jgi:predicted small secreted protein
MEDFSMKTTRIGLRWATLTLVLLPVLLAACETTAGAGRDISSAGQAITQSADQSQGN